MFKVPDHQVAGHQAREGQLGPLIDDSGRFYKPLQNNGRGSKELAFYRNFFSDPRIPPKIQTFFPEFFGIKTLEASDGSGLCDHIILEDLTCNLTNPSIADIKIGSRTWYPHASDQYIAKCIKKDRELTSLVLGFRISGLQILEVGEELEFWRPRKEEIQGFSAEDVRRVLRRFVSLDFDFVEWVLKELKELKKWFEEQTIFHFYSASVLLMKGNGNERGKVKLVDFAHVFDGNGVIDHNFLGGLCSMIKFLKEISRDSLEEDSKLEFANGGGK